METDAFSLAKPYRLYWGWCDSSWEDFATFHEAQTLWSKTPGSRIVNRERLDGAEGGNETGLTSEERYGLELVEQATTMSATELEAARGPWCEQCGEREEPACWDGRCVGAG